jgi:HD-GYP domain-containing protein (c-di-GMP phosphodiesterase class II)
MFNAVRQNRIPIIHHQAAHCLLPHETVRHAEYADCESIAASSTALLPFDEFRPEPPFVDRLLDQSARERTRCPENTQIDTLRRLASVAEWRDGDSGSHPHRVGELSARIGRSLNLPEYWVERIRIASWLHDIGKIGIPDEILLKPGKLTTGEYEKIKSHTTIGSATLSGSRFPSLQLAEEIALYHHERWDGTGYWGIHSGAIPLEARIVSIADTFDVLTHRRPYKQAWSVSDAVAEIKSQSGRQFDPQLVDAFTRYVCPDGLQALSDIVRKPAASTRFAPNVCNSRWR